MTWNLMHTARRLKEAGGTPPFGNLSAAWTDGNLFEFDASPEVC